jgi:hypothetical protein
MSITLHFLPIDFEDHMWKEMQKCLLELPSTNSSILFCWQEVCKWGAYEKGHNLPHMLVKEETWKV